MEIDESPGEWIGGSTALPCPLLVMTLPVHIHRNNNIDNIQIWSQIDIYVINVLCLLSISRYVTSYLYNYI